MTWKHKEGESTIHMDTFVLDDYSISMRANLTSIEYSDAKEKRHLDELYERDYKHLKEELKNR